MISVLSIPRRHADVSRGRYSPARQGPVELGARGQAALPPVIYLSVGVPPTSKRCGIASRERPLVRTQLFVSGGRHRDHQIADDVHGRFASIAL
jgi:hypothetical protein